MKGDKPDGMGGTGTKKAKEKEYAKKKVRRT